MAGDQAVFLQGGIKMTNLDRINIAYAAALISDAAEFIGSALEYCPELLNIRLAEYEDLVNKGVIV